MNFAAAADCKMRGQFRRTLRYSDFFVLYAVPGNRRLAQCFDQNASFILKTLTCMGFIVQNLKLVITSSFTLHHIVRSHVHYDALYDTWLVRA